MFNGARDSDNRVEALQRPSLKPLMQASAPIRFDESVTSADDGDPLGPRDDAVDDIGPISMGVHNVRAILPTKRAYSASLTEVITIADVKWECGHSVRLECNDERGGFVSGGQDQHNTHRVAALDMSGGEPPHNGLEPAEMGRGD